MKLTEQQFETYASARNADKDGLVREWLDLSENRYFTVSIWPVRGEVRLTGHREVRAVKISKSSQTA